MIRLRATRKTTYPLSIRTGEAESLRRTRTVRRDGRTMARAENHRTEGVVWLQKGGEIGPLPDSYRSLPDVVRYQKQGFLVILEEVE